MGEKPVFYVLRRRLPSSETPNMLGRFVRHFQDPTAEYTPEEPAKHIDLTNFILKTDDYETGDAENPALKVKSAKDDKLKSILRGLLSVSFSHAEQREMELDSPCLTTRRLKNFRTVFQTLKAVPEVRRAVLEMLPVGGKIYLVVGIMTFSTAIVRHEGNKSASNHTEAKLPIGNVVTAAVGAPPIMGTQKVGVAVEQSSSTSSDWASRAKVVAEGDDAEEIFAVEYRVVTRDWAGLGKEPVYRPWAPAYRGGLTYGRSIDVNRSDEDDEDDEDEDSAVQKVEILESELSPGGVGHLGGKSAELDESGFLYYS